MKRALKVGDIVRLPKAHATLGGWYGRARVWEVMPRRGVVHILPEGVEYDGPQTLKLVGDEELVRVRK